MVGGGHFATEPKSPYAGCKTCSGNDGSGGGEVMSHRGWASSAAPPAVTVPFSAQRSGTVAVKPRCGHSAMTSMGWLNTDSYRGTPPAAACKPGT